MIFLQEIDEPVTTPQQEARLREILQQQNGGHLASFLKVIFVNGKSVTDKIVFGI